jgi:ribokinase
MNKIAVVGSINVDLVVQVDRFPRQGETVQALEFAIFPGGKGANQAVGASRLEGEVVMFGMVGSDVFGKNLIESLQSNGVKTDNVVVKKGISSGIASIMVDSQGNNVIVITPGANGQIDEHYIDSVLSEIKRSDVLLLQFEIPLKTIDHLLRKLPPSSPQVILDPAPVRDLRGIHTKRIDIITPNETELQNITGIEIKDARDIKESANLLNETGVKAVICKYGDKGSYLITPEKFAHFPAHKVKVVDTTAAGDAFNAGLAVALSRGKDLEEAIRYANAAGALATTVIGAQPSMPSVDLVEGLLKKEGLS